MKKSSHTAQAIKPVSCLHCGLPVSGAMPSDDAQFCCRGCECVYQLLQGLGLKEFYSIKQSLDIENRQAALSTGSQYTHFNDPQFQESHVHALDGDFRKIDLFVEGIHCAACVWLLERLPEILSGVTESRVHFESSSLVLVYQAGDIQLSEIASCIDSLGYKPVPKTGQSAEEHSRKQKRDILLRLAVAGVCAGNTMMIAISLYQGWFSGMEQRYVVFFHWLSFLVSIPAVTYSAQPFYRAALGGLRVGGLHIDLPISIGIILGFSASVFNTLVGATHVYFDSICMLIFLLLLGRWLQKASLDHVLSSRKLIHTLIPLDAVSLQEGEEVLVYSGSLIPGQVIRVKKHQAFPVDGEVINGKSFIDTSVLTGESDPQRVGVGDLIYAGTKNLGEDLDVLVERSGISTRLGKLVENIDDIAARKPRIIQETDRIARWFVAIVVLLASGTSAYWYMQAGLFVAIDRALALLVVSCPCALGLAAPISLSIAQKRAASMGLFIRSAEALERLAGVRTVCLDKTGTITQGVPTVVGIVFAPGVGQREQARALEYAFALEQGVTHPFASAIRAFASPVITESSSLEDIRSIIGRGVQGVDKSGALWRLGSERFLVQEGVSICEELKEFRENNVNSVLSTVFIAKGDVAFAALGIGESLKADAREFVGLLKEKNYQLYILSGDSQAVVDGVARRLEIDLEKAFGELSPEDKLAKIELAQASSPTLMLGDGANDAAAFAASSIGIAVHGGAETSLRTADVFVSEPRLLLVNELLSLADRTLWVIKRNLLFSALYNVLGAGLAIFGFITPLAAAVLMPISSLTVVLSSSSLMREKKPRKNEKL